MVKKLAPFFVVILFLVNVVNAQNITVSATTDTSIYKVGDFIKLTLEINYSKNITIKLPNIKDSVKVLDFIEENPVVKKETDQKINEIHQYIFSKYDSAQVTIPSLKIFYKTVNDNNESFLETAPITITVSTLPVDTQKDIADVKAPVKFPIDWLLVLGIAFVVIAIVVGAYYLIRYYKRKKAGKESFVPQIKIPAHEIALYALKELENKKLWQGGNVKDYHSQVTEIIRRYFEDRFNFIALEMTSAEILAVLSSINEAKEIHHLVEGFFSNADLVKFAKFEPMPTVNEDMMIQAKEIVTKTIVITQETSFSSNEAPNVQ